MADKSGKTEEPTQRRQDKARKEGQFASAKEFVSALQFLLFLTLLGAGGARWFAEFRQTTRALLQMAFAPELRPEDLVHVDLDAIGAIAAVAEDGAQRFALRNFFNQLVGDACVEASCECIAIDKED